MIKTNHYIPILKWKRAEQGALAELLDKNKKHITPLIQFVMPKPKQQKKEEPDKTEDEIYNDIISLFRNKLTEIPKEILDYWGKETLFIDFSLIYATPKASLKIESYKKIIIEGNKLGLKLIPVLNLSDDNTLVNIVCMLESKYKNGICLRLVCSEFTDILNLEKRIVSFLELNSLSEDNIDLLVDIKEIEDGGIKYDNYLLSSQKLSNIKKWRSFIYAGGAFPKDLSDCKFDDENHIARVEWNQWINFFKNKKLQRNPSFADYTVQHPIYLESTQFFSPTTSIKYTLKDCWIIMKGKKQKYELYLANANILSKDEGCFFGENFSFGDKFIAEKGKHYEEYIKNPAIKGTGNTEQWLKASINHHLECTANQIANLP